ncbi:MAG: CC_3452 family protein [Caulobacteraceae bacterium]
MKHALAGAGLAALVSLLAAPAFAGGLSATLVEPGAAQFVASDTVWHCSGQDCSAGYTSDVSFGLAGCEGLVRQAGRVTAFSDPSGQLSAKKLEKCNKVAKTPTAVAQARR